MVRIIFSIFLIVVYSSVQAANSDMQAISCAPNGFTNVMKEKFNHKRFWSEQVIRSESMLKYLRYGEGAED